MCICVLMVCVHKQSMNGHLCSKQMETNLRALWQTHDPITCAVHHQPPLHHHLSRPSLASLSLYQQHRATIIALVTGGTEARSALRVTAATHVCTVVCTVVCSTVGGDIEVSSLGTVSGSIDGVQPEGDSGLVCVV